MTVGALPRSAIPPTRGIRHANSSGVALILTLGLLAIVTLAVVAFVVTMRIEHLAAGNTLNRTISRQYIDIGLSAAMGTVDSVLTNRQSSYPVQKWDLDSSIPPDSQTNDCLGVGVFLPSDDAPIQLFCGSATNLLPGVLAAQAGQVLSRWYSITATNSTTGANGITNGRVAFLIVNLSGMMDVHALNTSRCQTLGEPAASAYNLINTSAYQRVFLTQPDLTAANNQVPVSNLVTFSYDPNPEVFFTNTLAFGTRAFTNNLPSRFNINSATQYVGNYNSTTFQNNWLTPVSNLLANAGVPFPDQVAWNILNYIDPGQVPIVAPADQTAPYRTGYGVKDVPLINKVALEQIPGTNPEYSVSVELWYPFVPHASPDNTRTKLRVGVYTNDSFLTEAKAAIASGGEPPLSLMSFEVPVFKMNYGDKSEFFVGSTTNPPSTALQISFKEVITLSDGSLSSIYHKVGESPSYFVWIWPRVYVDNTCVDEALVNATTGAADPLRTWTEIGSVQFADPRANNTLASAIFTNAYSLGTTNANCSVSNLPLVHADAPMLSAGELRHIYAPGMPNLCLDLATPTGAACRDRFTVSTTNAPVHGLVQANTPYTNIWKAILSDVTVGWTNSVVPPSESFYTVSTWLSDPADQNILAGAIASAAWNGIHHSDGSIGGWNRYQEMLPLVASNLDVIQLNGTAMTNALTFNERGDILAGIADRVSFRQNTFLVIVCGQRLSPLGRVLADQRAAITVVRDAFTGRWVVDHAVWLTE